MRKHGNIIMFYVPKELHKERMFFTTENFLKSIIFGTREYVYASRWYINIQDKYKEQFEKRRKKAIQNCTCTEPKKCNGACVYCAEFGTQDKCLILIKKSLLFS